MEHAPVPAAFQPPPAQHRHTIPLTDHTACNSCATGSCCCCCRCGGRQTTQRPCCACCSTCNITAPQMACTCGYDRQLQPSPMLPSAAAPAVEPVLAQATQVKSADPSQVSQGQQAQPSPSSLVTHAPLTTYQIPARTYLSAPLSLGQAETEHVDISPTDQSATAAAAPSSLPPGRELPVKGGSTKSPKSSRSRRDRSADKTQNLTAKVGH